MAKDQAQKSLKPRAKRSRINVSMTAEQLAQLRREVPEKEIAQYCRDRIFSASGLRDPMVDVGARLLGMVALYKHLTAAVERFDDLVTDGLQQARRSPESGAFDRLDILLAEHRYDDFRALVEEARALHGPLLREAREVLRLLSERHRQTLAIPVIKERDRG